MSLPCRRCWPLLALALACPAHAAVDAVDNQTLSTLRAQAEAGDPAAAQRYGCLFIDQPGVEPDAAKARQWVEQARNLPALLRRADAGDTDAMVQIGDTYFDTCLHDSFAPLAMAWYRKAVAGGDIRRAWRLMDDARTLDEKRHWAEIAAAIVTPEGKPRDNRYGGETFFGNLAEHSGQDIPWGLRHAPGTRYLSLRPLQVRLKPDPASPVIQDIGRWHLVYARPAQAPGWLAVIAASEGPYPDTLGYLNPIDTASVTRFLDRQPQVRPDRQAVYGLVGYLRETDLASLDQPAPLPLPTVGLMPVPSLWRGIGIEEDRRFITDFSQPPYDALVQVKAQDGSCSGAVVGTPTLVVTAGHCVDKTDRKGKVQVIFERSAEHKEVIPATLVSYQHKGGADWALLRLRKAPATPVTPLAFADSFDAARSAQLQVAAIGYPGDLFKLSMARLGFVAPSLKQCTLDISRHSYNAQQRTILFNHYCNIWFGDSGGPLLVWNSGNARFELLGVHAGVDDGFEGTHRKTLFTDSRFRALMYKAYQDVEVPLLGNRQQALDKAAYFRPAQQADKDNPGVSTVARAYRERVESLYFDRSTLSLALIDTLRQQAGQGPRRDAPDKLGFWTTPPEDGFKAIGPVDEARLACAATCNKAVLRASGANLRYGEPVDLQQMARRDDTLVMPGSRRVIVGGDLFHVGNDGRVDAVARQFMNLKASGPGFNAFYQSRYGEPAETVAKEESLATDVEPTSVLHAGPSLGSDTPIRIPGGQLITTAALTRELATPKPPVVIAAIGASTGIPGAIDLHYGAEGGAFSDQTQQRLANDLQALTHGDKARALVFYGHHPQCWMSYNSALRAIALGYRQVYWYRGGMKAWVRSGAPLDWQ
ncbi:trypsin-like peptidase domain-containing protein [Pseudomonas sichuanensis]|uniref:trypsin-like peptidase domain-containing protein n=1 Tax=Pseudomonas sichuanensis TaxID=2213015 RepID=UPI002ABA9771|nr:trypsin-like peptidase domain-containing protein [Pseudomonas sichuanensis]MDZ4017373.1 hypothetical protein [Pseudomonas sichuanensis]